jgi:glycosyltransferase involved in cell wall biosynthesis
MRSIRQLDPSVRRVIVLCDLNENYPPVDPDVAEVLSLEVLPLTDLDHLISRYTLIELNTAIKPSCFLHLAQEGGYKNIIYFDPDIRLYQNLDTLRKELDSADALLTPHICQPIDDDHFPGEQVFLQNGIYNLGFVAMRISDSVLKFLNWWNRRLHTHCIIDLENGYFVDQKWMDYAPALLPHVKIVRDPGWNIAYWNILHREVTQSDGQVLVNGHPLFFFHFSGLATTGNIFSKHQDRFKVSDLTPATQELIEEYRSAIRENGLETYRTLSCDLSRFADGTRIPDYFHNLYLQHPKKVKSLGPLTAPDGKKKWATFAKEVPSGYRLLNRLALHVYESRPDLKSAFPEVASGLEAGYAAWFIEHAESQSSVDPEVVEDVKNRMSGPGEPASEHLPGVGLFRGVRRHLFRMAYKIGFILYPLICRVTSVNMRSKVYALIKKYAYNPSEIAVPQQPLSLSNVPEDRETGVSLVGYLEAESGVGRAARLTRDALKTMQGIPLSCVPVSTGCVSRMEASIEDDFAADETNYPISIFQVNADMVGEVMNDVPDSIIDVPIRIGYWYWELADFPGEWLGSFQPFQEIWVSSSHCQQSIGAKSPVPVLVMPPPVTVHPNSDLDRTHFGLPEKETLFLCMADALSFLERKNPFGAYSAFKEAFPKPGSGAKLIIKLINEDRAAPEAKPWLNTLENDPDVILLRSYLSQEEVDSLNAACDAYLSLHRAEGFGLPIAEAMCLGKPVIATGWSANMEFMNTNNSLPVRYNLVELEHDHGPYKRGQQWAEPDEHHAATLIRKVHEKDPTLEALSSQAAQDMQDRFSPEASGKRMKERINHLLSHGSQVTG